MGGVSERPAQEGSRSDPRDRLLPRRWKAPGLRDDVALRGAAPERGSRPVRRRSWRSLPLRADAPATTGAPWTPRRGTSSACVQHHTHPARGHGLPLATNRGHVLHSVQGPVHVERGSTLTEKPAQGNLETDSGSGGIRQGNLKRPRGGAVIAVGQTRATGRNRHRGSSRRAERGSPHVTVPQGSREVTCQKRKEVAASVPARISRARVRVPVRRSSCRSR